MSIHRRSLVAGVPALLAGCVAPEPPQISQSSPPEPSPAPLPVVAEPVVELPYRSIYAAIGSERYHVPAVDLRRILPQFLRREVPYPRDDEAGTIVVDTGARYAYLVLENGRAMRYGVAVGRQDAFNVQGEAIIERKAEWPNWRPTPAMVARDPQRYGALRAGLPGGTRNPLGSRALYLYQDGEDTHNRLHGTYEPWTIGTMASSGCVRMINQDIIDLYQRVPVGTRVIVLPTGESVA
jgi:lipoprotein-anchoring transpeptidase ErfK/SrfK